MEDRVVVDERKVNCDGGSSALGHPKIYLEIVEDDQIACPYCGRLFIYNPKAVQENKSA